MKIALFSDIHANLPALEAFFADLETSKPDAIYCLGDLVGYNVWPNEVISEIRKRGIATLAGNHDPKAGKLITTADSLKEPGKNYGYHLITQENRKYLATLPAHIRLEFKLNDSPLNIVLTHGSTRSIDEYVLEDLEESYVLEMMTGAKADVLCVGHSHKPYHRILQASSGFKHVINTGSVGKPKDGNPKGGYVLLTLDENSSLGSKEGLEVEFIRFAYDVEKVATAVEESSLPDEFAEGLRKAQ